MEIKPIVDNLTWDDFICKNENTFLHSWCWGKFNQNNGNKVWRFGVFEGNIIISIFLSIKITAKRGSFIFVPHGPIIDKSQHAHSYNQILNEVKKQLITLADEENCSFIRIAPILNNSEENIHLFQSLGFIKAPIHMHSEMCWILDLKENEDEILKKMRKTTRYLINQKDKHNISVSSSRRLADFDKFYDVYKKTESRQKFVGFSKKYLQTEFDTFSKENKALLFFATQKSQLLSVAMIILHGSSGYYHHGASDLLDPKIHSAYIIQWEIIKYLKENGFGFYNFWGIAPEHKTKHPWKGLTNFKKGFGGFILEFVPTQDYILNKSYVINLLIESIRKIKRRF